MTVCFDEFAVRDIHNYVSGRSNALVLRGLKLHTPKVSSSSGSGPSVNILEALRIPSATLFLSRILISKEKFWGIKMEHVPCWRGRSQVDRRYGIHYTRKLKFCFSKVLCWSWKRKRLHVFCDVIRYGLINFFSVKNSTFREYFNTV